MIDQTRRNELIAAVITTGAARVSAEADVHEAIRQWQSATGTLRGHCREYLSNEIALYRNARTIAANARRAFWIYRMMENTEVQIMRDGIASAVLAQDARKYVGEKVC